MGNKLFKTNISGIIHKSMSKGLLSATLIKVVSGARTTGSLTSGRTKTETSYTCKGFTGTYEDKRVDGTIIQRGDRKILLIGDSIQSGAIPELNDKITIEGHTYNIVGPVERDPAAATYVCQGRK